ncbi:MAG: hypothetical protein OXN21_00215 [Chloroflexota bacterium]|nr:hypothetical protein [Chloroflexota bacterium]
MDKQTERTLYWHSFIYEVNRATASLMYLLQGMETVRARELPPYDGFPSNLKYSFPSAPKPPGVDVPLLLGGPSFDPHTMLDPQGEAEQLAFKGWVVQVYDQIWEANFRNHFKDGYEGDDLIRPLSQPFGDFGHIRNDLVHNKGVAKATETGKCKVLTWFEPGERMILGMRHVLDFLNQAGFMHQIGGFIPSGAHAAWSSIHLKESDLKKGTIPKLISVGASFDRMLEDGSVYYAIAVVFENGVFCNIAIHDGPSEKTGPEWIEFVNKTDIDAKGNLRLANGQILHRESLYHDCVDGFLNPGPAPYGMQVGGPWYKFRRG